MWLIAEIGHPSLNAIVSLEGIVVNICLPPTSLTSIDVHLCIQPTSLASINMHFYMQHISLTIAIVVIAHS